MFGFEIFSELGCTNHLCNEVELVLFYDLSSRHAW